MPRLPHGLLVATLTLSVVSAQTTQAAVDVKDEVHYYDIQGEDAVSLTFEISAKGPPGASGDRFAGFTNWQVTWRWRYRDIGGGCAIESVLTTVSVRITLPRWLGERRADLATQENWARYQFALEQHESGHRRNGIAAGQEIDQSLASMLPAANCALLGAKANALGKSIVQKYIQRDLVYDWETGHGATQGARFP